MPAPLQKQYRKVLLTIKPSIDDAQMAQDYYVSRLRDNSYRLVERMKYGVITFEIGGDTGYFHGHFFGQFKPQVTPAMIREVFGGDVHIEASRTNEAARAYCMKEETRVPGIDPVEFGTFEQTQGKRTDLTDAIECMRDEGFSAMVEQFPEVFVRSGRGLELLYRRLYAPKTRDEHFVPREWQAAVVAALTAEPDDRTIYWVTDATGGAGKSRLARHLVAEHGGLLLSGKLADMAYILGSALESVNVPKIAVFDISRAAAEHTDHLYSMAEQIKNGLLVSNKYESKQLTFNPLQVIFFANRSWDRNKFSLDRVKEMNLGAGDVSFP